VKLTDDEDVLDRVEGVELGADAGVGPLFVSVLDGEPANDDEFDGEFAMGASPITDVAVELIGDGSGLGDGFGESRSGEAPEEGDRLSLDSKIDCCGGE
jgi:hypothetical protein